MLSQKKKKVDCKFKINLGYVVKLVSTNKTKNQIVRLPSTGLYFRLLGTLIQKDSKFKTKRTRDIAQG